MHQPQTTLGEVDNPASFLSLSLSAKIHTIIQAKVWITIHLVIYVHIRQYQIYTQRAHTKRPKNKKA